MESNNKDATAMSPIPDPAPTKDWVATNPPMNSSYFDDRSLDAGNKQTYLPSTPNYPPGSNGPKETNPVAAYIGVKSSVLFPLSVIKAIILHVEGALPKFIIALSTCRSSAHLSLKHIKTTLETENNN